MFNLETDPDSPPPPMTTGDKIFIAVISLIFVGLLTAELFDNYHPAKLSVLFFALWWGPLIALHEFGHAAVARLVDWRLGRIVIGMGKPVGRWQWGQTPVEFRLFPIGGFMTCLPRSAKGGRWKEFLIYFGGPGSELLLVGLIAAAFHYGGLHPAGLFASSSSVAIIALQSLALAALVGAITNLFPLTARSGNREVPNDGLGMLLALGRTPDYYAERATATFDEDTD